MFRYWKHSQSILLLFGGVISLLLTSKLFELSKFSALYQYDARLQPLKMEGTPRNYTYSVEDFPERWSKPRSKVIMEVEESVHYDIESMASAYEWKELTPGNGPVRLGPNFNVAVLPMIHQLHCVEVFKDTLKRNPSLPENWLHVQHCVNYLRQWAMCKADITLERGDFAQRHFDWDRKGRTHECHSWEGVFEAIQEDWDIWVRLWNKNDLNKYLYQPFEFKPDMLV